jgi:hypothetical protein
MNVRGVVHSTLMLTALALPLAAQSFRVPSGTEITVRTNDTIEAKKGAASTNYSAVVNSDVTDGSGRVLIPRGANAEVAVREAAKGAITLDLRSIEVDGRRFDVAASPEVIDADSGKKGVGKNKRTGKFVGGGAILGGVIGAIAGGGKGAAIGAASGAGAGAVGQTVTKDGKLRIPSESLVTFRLDRPLSVGNRRNR